MLRLTGLLLCIVLVVVHGVADEEGAASLENQGQGHVVSASDFLRRLHLHAEEPRRVQTTGRTRPARNIQRQRLGREIESTHRELRKQATRSAAITHRLSKLREQNAVQEHRVSEARSSEEMRLGESMLTQRRLSPKSLSAADQAALNLETSEAFPEDTKRMNALKKEFPTAVHQVASLRSLHEQNLRKRKHYEKLMRSMEDESEYDIMTNPDIAKADTDAQTKLQSLRQSEIKLATQMSKAKNHAKRLARQVMREEKLRAVSEKAMLLTREFKKRITKKVEQNEKNFQKQAVAAAEESAKLKYEAYMKEAEQRLELDKQSRMKREDSRRLGESQKEAERKEQRNARKKDRAKTRAMRRKTRALDRAKRLAEEDVRVRAQAEAMFNQYKAKFREMEQARSLASQESHDLDESDLGESASTDSSYHQSAKKKAQPTAGLSATLNKLQQVTEAAKPSTDLLATLDKIQATVAAKHQPRKAKTPSKREPVFGLDSA